METGFSVLMFVFGLCILLYGVYIYYSKKPYLPYRVEVSMKKTSAYKRYLAKMVMLISLCPILTGVVAFTGSVLITMIAFVGLFIILILLGNRIFEEK